MNNNYSFIVIKSNNFDINKYILINNNSSNKNDYLNKNKFLEDIKDYVTVINNISNIYDELNNHLEMTSDTIGNTYDLYSNEYTLYQLCYKSTKNKQNNLSTYLSYNNTCFFDTCILLLNNINFTNYKTTIYNSTLNDIYELFIHKLLHYGIHIKNNIYEQIIFDNKLNIQNTSINIDKLLIEINIYKFKFLVYTTTNISDNIENKIGTKLCNKKIYQDIVIISLYADDIYDDLSINMFNYIINTISDNNIEEDITPEYDENKISKIKTKWRLIYNKKIICNSCNKIITTKILNCEECYRNNYCSENCKINHKQIHSKFCLN
jgi:hypothetical protein